MAGRYRSRLQRRTTLVGPNPSSIIVEQLSDTHGMLKSILSGAVSDPMEVKKLAGRAMRLLERARTKLKAKQGTLRGPLLRAELDEEIRLLTRSVSSPLQADSFAYISSEFSQQGKSGRTLKLQRERAGRHQAPRPLITTTEAHFRIEDVTGLSQHVRECLAHCRSWEQFDVFRLDTLTHGRSLSTLLITSFEQQGLLARFQLDRKMFSLFAMAIEEGYLTNPYHNALHAADVLQNILFFFNCQTMRDLLSPLDVMAGLLAAAIHDFGHPGVSNDFLVNSDDELAIRYNDLAVLENMHLAEAFRILKSSKFNFLSHLDKKSQRTLRDLVVGMVLSTDMKTHTDLLSKMKSHLESDVPNASDKVLCLNVALHVADLGHPAKPWDLHARWTEALMEEFYAQGDREREMGIELSPMRDRLKPNVALSQKNFIDFVVLPLFVVIEPLIPEVVQCLDLLEDNRKRWHELEAAEKSESAQALASGHRCNRFTVVGRPPPPTRLAPSLPPIIDDHSPPPSPPPAPSQPKLQPLPSLQSRGSIKPLKTLKPRPS